MRDPCNDIREWLYNELTAGSGGVAVYAFPPENKPYPYIVIGESSAEGEDGAKDLWLWDVSTTVTIYTQHLNHDASYVSMDTITDNILTRLRRRRNLEGDLFAIFCLIRIRIGAWNTERTMTDNGIIISKQVSINLLVEEN